MYNKLYVKENYIKIFVFVLIALGYASLMYHFSNDNFRDRDNYLLYALNSENLLDSQSSLLSFLSNEPLFLIINSMLSGFFSFEIIPKLFVFFTVFSVVFLILLKANHYFLAIICIVLLLFNAQIFHLHLVVLRQGLATAMLMWFIFLESNLVHRKYFYYIFPPIFGFVHSSFFIFSLIIYIDLAFCFLFSDRLFYRILYQVVLSFIISLFGLILAGYFGARQADIGELSSSVNVSGGSFFLWMCIFFVLVLKYNKYKGDRFIDYSILFLVFYLAMYFISPIAGRLILSIIPFVLCALFFKIDMESSLALVIIFVFNALIFSSTVISNSLSSDGIYYFNLN